MGLKSRSKKKELRKRKKLAAKAARKALYEKYAAEGRVKGSRRARRRGPRLAKGIDHPLGPCGNIGCRKCKPEINARRRALV
jgi:hypothetical protein